MKKPGPHFNSRKAKATREMLFSTAMTLFDKKGYHRVSVDQICAQAEVCKATFYNHFTSKDQIIIEYFLRNDHYYEEIFEKLARFKTARKKLAVFSEAVIALFRQQGISVLKPVYYSQIAPSVRSSPMARKQRSLYTIIEKIVKEGQERGEIRTDRTSKELAQAITIFFRGIVYEWCLHDGKLDIEKARKSIHGLLEDALLKK